MLDRNDFEHTRVANKVIKDTTLKASDKSVYMVLSLYADNDTSECYPKRDTLIRTAGVSDKTLRNALNRLEERGYIAVEYRRRNGKQSSNLYRLL